MNRSQSASCHLFPCVMAILVTSSLAAVAAEEPTAKSPSQPAGPSVITREQQADLTPDAVLQELLESGWAVCGGERFRIDTAPAIRITISALPLEEAPLLASDLARILRPAQRTLSA